MRSTSLPARAVAVAAFGTCALAGCSGTDAPDSGSQVTVAAAFYGVEFVAETVAGERAEVWPLTPRGVSPHDLELSPSTVLRLGSADLVLYLSDFQAAVDDAVAETGVAALDVADVVELQQIAAGDDDHAEDEAAEDDHGHGEVDPHFWLDPTLVIQYGDALAAELTRLDPTGAEAYAAGAADLTARLTALDDDYAATLASCERDTIVVSHLAYGYLTERYGITQVGMSGLDPDTEPSAARLLEIQQLVADAGVTTIFTEDEVTQSVAESLAADTGTMVRVLGTGGAVETGDDYFSLMSRNLDALAEALDCG